jgi:hypothetical protein
MYTCQKVAGQIIQSQLQLVDLAGSERLQAHHQYIPYRASTLTRIMQKSLQQKIFFIATISPSVQQVRETVQTLSYAAQIKLFGNDVMQNIVKDVKFIKLDQDEYYEKLQQLEKQQQKAAELELLLSKTLEDEK